MQLSDIDLDFLLEYILDEDLVGQKANRGESIKNKMGLLWKGVHGFGPDQFDAFLDKLGEADPTLNGRYMPWMARLILTKPNENRAEDLDRVGEDLEAFEKFRQKIERKDINQYKSFADLYDVIAPFLVPKKKTKDELSKEKLADVRKEIITVYNGPEGWIRIPTTQAAAMHLGKGTRWCTSARRNNKFDEYAKDDNLFVIYDRAQGDIYRKWQADKNDLDPSEKKKLKPPPKGLYQLHIKSGQFAQDDDRNLEIKAVPDWPKLPIVNYYKKNNPQLTRDQIFHLSAWAGENLAKGTAHEEIIDLMKQHKI